MTLRYSGIGREQGCDWGMGHLDSDRDRIARANEVKRWSVPKDASEGMKMRDMGSIRVDPPSRPVQRVI